MSFKLLLLVLMTLSFRAEAASPIQSAQDSLITIKNLSVYPVTDNANGIYARVVEEALISVIEENHKFNNIPIRVAGNLITPEDIESDANKAQLSTKASEADAIVLSQIRKTGSGVDIQMNLVLKKDGKLLIKESVQSYEKIDSANVALKTKELFKSMLKKLPYEGLILSRNQEQVTLNLGSKDGIKEGEILTLILVFKLNRHPKFDFLVSSEKEILGKIKIEKVDETISFAKILTEKEVGAIQADTKIKGKDFVNYAEFEGNKMAPTDNQVTFGKMPVEWKPVDPPTYGLVGLALGLGTYSSNSQLSSAGTIDADKNIFPQLRLEGELWLTPQWFANVNVNQGVMSLENPLSGSTPTSLSVSLSHYSVLFGYNFLFTDDFFGSKVSIKTGYSKYSRFVDTSDPLSITSGSYSGLVIGLSGSLPITDNNRWSIGADLEMFLTKSLSESPQTSGSESDNSITNFSFYLMHRLTERLRLKGAIDFELYTSQFSGSGTRSDSASTSSDRIVTYNGGLQYLF